MIKNDQQHQGFEGLRALFINTSLKPSLETSYTQELMDLSVNIMKREGANVENVRLTDQEIPHGMLPDMTHNRLQLAAMQKAHSGYSRKGNSMDKWKDGERWKFQKLQEACIMEPS